MAVGDIQRAETVTETTVTSRKTTSTLKCLAPQQNDSIFELFESPDDICAFFKNYRTDSENVGELLRIFKNCSKFSISSQDFRKLFKIFNLESIFSKIVQNVAE